MADEQPSAVSDKPQIGKLTHAQLGASFARNIVEQISSVATGVRNLVEKGQAVDNRTGKQISVQCLPEDIAAGFSDDQRKAVQDFVSVWAVDNPQNPK